MNPCAALLLSLLLSVSATAQLPGWDIGGASEVSQNIDNLPTQDQQGILRQLREEPANLRAIRVEIPAGHLFLVQGFGDICGAANCAFWILSGEYKVLLRDIVEDFKLQKSEHNGRPDIVTRMHGSAFESDLTRWQFNGVRYLRTACVSVAYADRDGNELKRPRIVPRPCGR